MREYTGQEICDILDIPENNIDIGLWALIIAKEYNSSIDVQRYLDALDLMTIEINKMISGRQGDLVKFLMTKMFIYDAGPWNKQKPFSYDLDDPLGKNLENQLLSSYLKSRKGNCVSMPTLFLALMERVDPNVPLWGSRAPLHLFCRFYDRQTGDVWNIESTNGGNPTRNVWYKQSLGITQTAIDSGAYLGDLSKKEYLAELLNTLISKCRRQENYKKALEYTELILKINLKSITGLVHSGALYSWLGFNMVESTRSSNRLLASEEKILFDSYRQESITALMRAGQLGWKPESSEQRTKYIDSVNREKQKTKPPQAHGPT